MHFQGRMRSGCADRTRSRSSRVTRYAAMYKSDSDSLEGYIKRKEILCVAAADDVTRSRIDALGQVSAQAAKALSNPD